MNINRLRRHWDALGKTDRLGANLTNEDNAAVSGTPTNFLTGEQEIEEVMDFAGLGDVPARSRPHFGCGVGRLTQALAARFDDVWGVDIAPSMIEAANRYNRHPGRRHDHLNDRTDLGRFDDASFDFIYSNIVLQHMQPRDQRRNLAELVRGVGGAGRIFVFQLPASRSRCPSNGWSAATQGTHQVHHPVVRPCPVPARASKQAVTGSGMASCMEMWGQPEDEVRRYVASLGAKTISVTPLAREMAFGWSGFRYVVNR